MDAPEAVAESGSPPSVEQINERAASMARLVDSFLRGRARPSARNEAAAAVSDVRAFVRVWRPTSSATSAEPSQVHNDEGNTKPSADVLLKLAQRGVQLHNNARKLPQVRDSSGSSGGGGGSVHHDWKSATVAYLRATAASLVSLGSTSSPKDCANLCRLFSKAGELLVEEAGDDVRALEMFDDAQTFFRRLPGSFYGAGGQSMDMPSLSAEDLIMAMHKASSRRVEVLSRTTGNVDQMLDGYELQLKILTKWSPAGLSVSTAVHAASVGEERFKKGDCGGASRLLRLALKALGGGDLNAVGAAAGVVDDPTVRTTGLRRTILFSLAHCYSKSGDHDQAIKCIKQLEGEGTKSTAGGAQDASFLFAKCKVLNDAGDRTGAYETAEALVATTPTGSSTSRVVNSTTGGGVICEANSSLDLVSVRMICSREDCSNRSLDLFASIASRCAGSQKAIEARVALLQGLVMAAKLRGEGCGAGQSIDGELAGLAKAVVPREAPAHGNTTATEASADQVAADRAEITASVLVDETAKCKNLGRTQVKAVIEVLVTFAEFFQGRGRWEACARWCERAITLANGLPNQSVAASSALASTETAGPRDSRKGIEGEAAPLLLASLLTLKGEMESRMGDFVSSGHTLDQALAESPTYGRAREVAFWSAALDPNRDESSLSARLSALSGLRSGLTLDDRREFLAKCVRLVAGARTTRGRRINHPADRVTPEKGGAGTPPTMGTTDGEEQDGLDGRVLMVQERLLEALLLTSAATGKVAAPVQEHSSSSPSVLHEPTGDEDRKRSAPIPMDVDVEGGGDSGGMRGAEGGVAVGSDSTTGKSDVPTAIQVVASMVDSALQGRKYTSEEGVRSSGGADADAASSSILSRVLLSVDKALSSAASLGINPQDDPDIEYLSQGCWNLAVRCCGSTCDLPWADSVGRSATNDRCDLVMTDVIPVSRQEELLVLAPAFFKASRNWTEMRSDANVADALLTRQHCMILSIAATLELSDLRQADAGSTPGSKGSSSSESHAHLERARKEVEDANGLNRQLSNVNPDMACEMRSILLVAEMSVLGRLGDAIAVRSLVSSREPDFLRCSTSLLQYCVQLAEDMLDDAKSISGLCRLCIQRCLEDDPVDTMMLGGLYRQLLVSASNREEALAVVDQFTARARDLQEGPAMPSEDVDYFSAKCYNLGLQQMELGRPGEAERFVGKALGLVKLGSSQAFAGRWKETIYQVYLTALQAKGSGVEPSSSSSIDPGDGRPTISMGEAFGAGRSFLSTGLFPMPSNTTGQS